MSLLGVSRAFHAVSQGNVAQLISTIESNAAATIVNETVEVEAVLASSEPSYESGLLLHACRQHQEEIVSVLLSLPGIDVNLGSMKTRTTAFADCCARGDLPFARLLARDGRVDITAGDLRHPHPAYFAAAAGHVELLALFIARGWGLADAAERVSLEDALLVTARDSGNAVSIYFLESHIASMRSLIDLSHAPSLQRLKVRLTAEAASTAVTPASSALSSSSSSPPQLRSSSSAFLQSSAFAFGAEGTGEGRSGDPTRSNNGGSGGGGGGGNTAKFIALDDYEAIAIALHLGHTDEEIKKAQRELLSSRTGGVAAPANSSAGEGRSSSYTTSYVGGDRRTLVPIEDVVNYIISKCGFE